MTLAEIVQSAKAEPLFFRDRLSARIAKIRQENPALNAFLRSYFNTEIAEHVWERLANEKKSAPLFGTLFAVKDNIAVKEQPLSLGLKPPLSKMEPKHAALVEHLIRKGSTLLGSTNLDPFAAQISGENPNYGNVRNPLYPERIPCGSSSGSAAAVAADWVDFAVGTDFGGSLRAPAAACAVCGLKTSPRLLPADGALLLDSNLDSIGYLAPSIEDFKLLLQTHQPDNAASVAAADCELLLPCSVELARTDYSLLDEFKDLTQKIGSRVRVYECDSELGFERALRLRKLLAVRAIALEVRRRELPRAVLPENIRAILSLHDQTPAEEFERVQAEASELQIKLAQLLSSNHIILTPTLSAPVPYWKDLHSAGSRDRALALNHFLPLANVGGLPALSFPIQATPEEIPLSLQLIGGPGQEQALVAVGGLIKEML